MCVCLSILPSCSVFVSSSDSVEMSLYKNRFCFTFYISCMNQLTCLSVNVLQRDGENENFLKQLLYFKSIKNTMKIWSCEVDTLTWHQITPFYEEARKRKPLPENMFVWCSVASVTTNHKTNWMFANKMFCSELDWFCWCKSQQWWKWKFNLDIPSKYTTPRGNSFANQSSWWWQMQMSGWNTEHVNKIHTVTYIYFTRKQLKHV